MLQLKKSKIKEICKKYEIKNYTINGDTIDVNGDVSLNGKQLTKLPLKFGTVTGHFDCTYNNLTSKLQCALIDASEFLTDFGDFKIPKNKHKKIRRIFENDN